MAANSLVLPFLALGLVALLVVQPREGAAIQQPAETCQALESLGSCSANTACTEADCSFSVLGSTYTFELTLLPCNEPPAVRVIILSGSSVLRNIVLERSQTFSLSISGIVVDIVATFDQTARGVGVSIRAQVRAPFRSINIISYTEIPLETADCTATTEPPTHASGPTSTLPTMPTVAASTCEVLRELAADPGSDDFECSTNEACNGVNCAANLLGNGDYRASAVILSCNDPPAVRLTIVDPSSTVLLNDTFDHSRSVPISLGLQVTVTVTVTVMVEQLTNAIAIHVQIDAIPPPVLGQGTIAVIGYTVIPIDSSQCGSTSPAPIQTSSTTDASTTPSTAAPTTPSTAAPTTPSTCPPTCSPEVCRSNGRGLCSLPENSRASGGCADRCQVTYCRACYYAEATRESPDCGTCEGSNVEMDRCFRRWSICAKRASGTFDRLPRRLRTEENYRCYSLPYCTIG